MANPSTDPALDVANTDPAAPRLPFASLWRRLAAALYDALLLLAIFMSATLALVIVLGRDIAPNSWWFTLLLLALSYSYFTWSWVARGQTLGGRAWRIRVTRADGGALDWATASRRFAVAVPAVGLALLGLLWSRVDRERRGWHDLAADTRVIAVDRDGHPALIA